MLESILRGIKQRWRATSKWGVVSWTFDQLTSLTNIAFGAAGAVLMSTSIPKLTAFLTSGVAVNSLVADAKAILNHKKSITKGGWAGLVLVYWNLDHLLPRHGLL